MIKTTPTTAVTITPTATSNDYFAIPKKIVTNGKLSMLSGYALSLYLFLAYKLYRRRKQAWLYANSDLARALDMTVDDVREARQELRAHGLIGYKPSKGLGFLYWFSGEDISAPTPQQD